jgi:ABC-2 type transport system ATP-binding protein
MIDIRVLTKRYGDTLAVDRLSFQVRRGQVTGLLGPNGSGKSTAMRLILGLASPTVGEARIDGQRYQELTWPLRQVGAMLDPTAVYPGRTAAGHLRWIARTNRICGERVAAVLQQAGLASAADRPVGGFSLGMLQRLGIAAALLGDPGTVILDEPVNGLDAHGVRWVRCLLRDLARQGRAVLVASHLMSEMQLTADRILIIGRGRLLADTTVADLTAGGTSLEEAYLSLTEGSVEFG